MTIQPSTNTPSSAGVSPAGAKPLLRVENLTKDFGALRALDAMNMDLVAGEVHVLFGENGAGKSTLINIICGALPASSGRVFLDGAPLETNNVAEARRKGIAAVFQEFSLAPDLSVEQNLFLGTETVRHGLLERSEMKRRARKLLDELGFALDPDAVVAKLSRAECQMVEIAKAVLTEPRILIFDEPTASLTEAETGILFDLIARLKTRGVGMIYITHRIDEILRIGDRVTVMRDGCLVETRPASEASKTGLVEAMTGRKFGDFYPTIAFDPGDIVLSLRRLATLDGRVSDVSIDVRAGEIVGLAGLVGCGKSEIGRACFGLEPLKGGEITFAGEAINRPSPPQMIGRGMGFVPADRMREGLLLGRSTRENLSLAALGSERFSARGFLRRRFEKQFAQDMGARMGVRPLRVEGAVSDYSGGNKQKVLLGRSIASALRLLVLDEPTVGIDVGAKAEIYGLLAELIAGGLAVLLISSDLPEVLSLSNRVYVVRHGHIADELSGDRRSEDVALGSFFGG